MRTLVRFVASRLIASRVGRWALTVILFVIAAASLASYPDLAATEAQSDALTVLVTGVVCAGLGIVMLVVSIRFDILHRRVRRAEKAALARANELKESGLLLPIPALPPLPQGVSADDVAGIEDYANRMARLPLGDAPRVSPADAPAVFNRAVARVRRTRGDWSQLGEPIDTFVGLPRPLCFVGAAEIMHRLSYLSGNIFAPAGLRQGLRFIAKSQVNEPMQPDALVIRTKLLAGNSSKVWLDLAEQTLDRLRGVAPNHPRLPDAEAAIHLRRREYEAALACFDQVIANPPSPEEAFVAEANRAAALESLKRYDEALAAYSRVLELDPNDAWVWHNKSILLMNLGRLDEALETNTRALSIMNFSNARTIRERILAKRAEVAANAKAE